MHAPSFPVIPVDTLLMAYRNGIFPMADARDDPDIFWVEPQDRAIIPLDGFHCSKSLRKILRQDRFRISIDEAFTDVMSLCAAPRDEDGDSWISYRIAASYRDLFDAGHAHSIECWDGSRLVGGLYGVAFDRAFCGESMFARADNASKVALAALVALMRRAGYALLDCQFLTRHLSSLGAIEIKQGAYLALLAQARGEPRMTLPDAYASLSAESSDGSESTRPSSFGKSIAQSLTQTS
ncbi:leucyl/phenylalanyl-tRNA--protein transferase [Qipengyuania sp. JC766]|uniref:leucyl/phenylalanyl-tRNA--protein transferase n=1 Tax=Qipengyuania sp. JC766 TaxID=3232139 RepID=UPI0034589D0D